MLLCVLCAIAALSTSRGSSTNPKLTNDAGSTSTILLGKLQTYHHPPTDCLASSFPVGVLSGGLSGPKRRQQIRISWAQRAKKTCVIFLVGRLNGTWPEAEAKQYKDLLLFDFEDSYQQLSKKTAGWLLYAYRRFPEAKFVLKTDDDSYVRINMLQIQLNKRLPDYYGVPGKYKTGPIRDPDSKFYLPPSVYPPKNFPHPVDGFPPYMMGAGYVLSRSALSCLVKLVARLPDLNFAEDVLVGLGLSTCNIDKRISSSKVKSEPVIHYRSQWIIQHHISNISAVHNDPRQFRYKHPLWRHENVNINE